MLCKRYKILYNATTHVATIKTSIKRKGEQQNGKKSTNKKDR